jgi:hypothetical protein
MDDMGNRLGRFLGDVRGVAVEIAESMLMKDSQIVLEEWVVSERIIGDYEYITTLGCSNSDFQGVVMVAAPESCLKEFFDNAEDLRDVFGELANQFCGLLMDNEGFVDEFGVLAQTLPMHASKRAFFPRATAITGRIHFGETYIQVGFALRAFMMLLNR